MTEMLVGIENAAMMAEDNQEEQEEDKQRMDWEVKKEPKTGSEKKQITVK